MVPSPCTRPLRGLDCLRRGFTLFGLETIQAIRIQIRKTKTKVRWSDRTSFKHMSLKSKIATTEELRLPPGARYLAGLIDLSMQDVLIAAVDQRPWIEDLKRRVQHYGYRYDYRARTVTSDAYLGPLPQWASDLAGRLVSNGWFDKPPDQLIVNEYLPGQGISAHVDCVPCFGEVIASISLLSTCEMVFKERGTDQRRAVVLEPRSALLIAGPARGEWTHEIPARKSDPIEGQRVPRSRRLSLTFRTVEVS